MLRIPPVEVVVEQGEEKEAEGDGGDEAERFRLLEHGLEGGEEDGSIEIANGTTEVINARLVVKGFVYGSI